MSGQGQNYHYEFGRCNRCCRVYVSFTSHCFCPDDMEFTSWWHFFDSSIWNCGPRRVSQQRISLFQHRSHHFIILELISTSKEVVRNSTIHSSMKFAPSLPVHPRSWFFHISKFEWFWSHFRTYPDIMLLQPLNVSSPMLTSAAFWMQQISMQSTVCTHVIWIWKSADPSSALKFSTCGGKSVLIWLKSNPFRFYNNYCSLQSFGEANVRALYRMCGSS